MLKFFRRIRQKLIDEGNLRRYLIYAIGEILLVMIGILLALQVNNWNQNRKDDTVRIKYLQGIKSDLKSDEIQLKARIEEYELRLSYFKKINPKFEWNTADKIDNKPLNELKLQRLFHRPRTFRPRKASYNAMVNNGDLNLIKDISLLSNIQFLYDVIYLVVPSSYGTIKNREETIGWKYSRELSNFSIEDIKNSNNLELISDLSFYHNSFVTFHKSLKIIESSISETIKLIDLEMNN